jgi:hypothetical protein
MSEPKVVGAATMHLLASHAEDAAERCLSGECPNGGGVGCLMVAMSAREAAEAARAVAAAINAGLVIPMEPA